MYKSGTWVSEQYRWSWGKSIIRNWVLMYAYSKCNLLGMFVCMKVWRYMKVCYTSICLCVFTFKCVWGKQGGEARRGRKDKGSRARLHLPLIRLPCPTLDTVPSKHNTDIIRYSLLHHYHRHLPTSSPYPLHDIPSLTSPYPFIYVRNCLSFIFANSYPPKLPSSSPRPTHTCPRYPSP